MVATMTMMMTLATILTISRKATKMPILVTSMTIFSRQRRKPRLPRRGLSSLLLQYPLLYVEAFTLIVCGVGPLGK